MKQITVYGLLGKIKNGNIPNKIRFDGNVYEYHDKEHGYCRHEYDNTYVCLNSEYYLFDILNDEVKIIEEPLKEKIKKIKSLNNVGNSNDLGEFKDKQQLNNHILKDKINEIINVINEMKKGE